MSHTSSLAGADTLYDALFERYGIARMNSVTAFVETLKFLHHGGPSAAAGIVSMSCSGGEAALVADMAIGTQRVASRPSTPTPGPRWPRRSMNMSPSTTRSTTTPSSGTRRTSSPPPSPPCWAAASMSAMLILDVPTQPVDAARYMAGDGHAPMPRRPTPTGAAPPWLPRLPECMPLDLAARTVSPWRCPDVRP